MRLESQQVLRHEIEAIAAVEGEPCPQRVAALCPEARKIEQSHDVARLQRRPVKSPSVRRPGCPRRPRCPCRSSLIAHRCSWCTVPQVVLVSKRGGQCCRCQETHRSGQVSFLKRTGVVFYRQPVAFWEPSREKLLACFFFRNRFFFGIDA